MAVIAPQCKEPGHRPGMPDCVGSMHLFDYYSLALLSRNHAWLVAAPPQ